MKKRFSVLVLTLILAVTLIIPAMTSGFSISPPPAAPSLVIQLAASGTSIIRDYAVITEANWNPASTSTSVVRWQDFGASNIMMDGKIDISKVVNVSAPSYLFVAQKEGMREKKTMAALSELLNDPSSLKVYYLKRPAVNPKIERPVFFDDPVTGIPHAKYKLASGMEYQLLGGTAWTPVPSPEWNIELKEYKVEYSVRVAAAGDNAPSKVMKLVVPSMSAAPSGKLDIVKGEIKAKSGWLIKTVPKGGPIPATTGTPLTKATTFAVGVGSADDLAAATLGGNTGAFMFRVPSTEKKAGSAWASISVDLERNFALNTSAVGDYFALTARNVLVVGAVPMQMKNSKGAWKTVKNIKFADIDPVNGVEVRMAGTKTKLPGPAVILKLDRTNGALSLHTIP